MTEFRKELNKTIKKLKSKRYEQNVMLVHNSNVEAIKKVMGDEIESIKDVGFNSYIYFRMTNKKPIKEVKAPKLEIDGQELHDAIKIQLEVIKAEEEKKAESDKQATILLVVKSNDYIGEKGESIEMVDEGFYERRYCSNYVDNLKQKIKNVKTQYTKRLIRSIISSLGLGATAMFLILNT